MNSVLYHVNAMIYSPPTETPLELLCLVRILVWKANITITINKWSTAQPDFTFVVVLLLQTQCTAMAIFSMMVKVKCSLKGSQLGPRQNRIIDGLVWPKIRVKIPMRLGRWSLEEHLIKLGLEPAAAMVLHCKNNDMLTSENILNLVEIYIIFPIIRTP